MPEQVDMSMFGIYHDFLKELSFSEEEHNKFQIIHREDGEVKWKNDKMKEFNIGNKILSVIKGRLEACQEKELLGEEHMNLFTKFVKDEK
ncbi:MAG: hypothetical protein ACYC5G_02115 [Candidatus Doudnabacteria bacterium]